MKISQDLFPRLDRQKSQLQQSNPIQSFQEVMGTHTTKVHHDELTRILTALEKQGQRLSRSRTFTDLSRYKTLVQQFIQTAVNSGLELKQSREWNAEGRGQVFHTIQTIDEQLIELTDLVVDNEKSSLDILDKIGEVKGLLINIYG